MELSSGTYVKNEARASVMESMSLGSWRSTQKAPTERVSPSNNAKGKKVVGHHTGCARSGSEETKTAQGFLALCVVFFPQYCKLKSFGLFSLNIADSKERLKLESEIKSTD